MLASPRTYKHFAERSETLNEAFLKPRCEEILRRADRAESHPSSDGEDGWVAVVRAWNSVKAYVTGEGSRISYRLAGDVTSARWESAEKAYRESVVPVYEEFESKFYERLLASRHRVALERIFGPYLFRKLEVLKLSLDPRNGDHRVRIGELNTQYNKRMGTAQVDVRGQTLTLSQARELLSSPDRVLRQEAWLATQRWVHAHRDEIAALYSEQVQLRDRMGKTLGMPDFIPLGYAAMARTDYGASEVAGFRDSLREQFLPLAAELERKQARELGVDPLAAWDRHYSPEHTLPMGVLPVNEQLERAQRLFDEMSPQLGRHVRRMRDEGLIDLENRSGKQPGAFCTSFPDEGRVAIFCNSTGNAEDLSTLTHELGHAFQAWESQSLDLVELQWPTYEAAEIHSMGMEFLSLRLLHHFFDEPLARKFRKRRWWSAVSWFGTMALIDHFQHEVYSQPTLDAVGRERVWLELQNRYQPRVDFGGHEFARPLGWYRVGHLFHMPFYFIDYAIAEVAAMQLALMDAKDSAGTLEKYLELCKIGGSRSMPEIFAAAGLRSPFDPSLLKDLAQHAARELELS